MAVTAVSANLTWQQVKMALAQQNSAVGIPQIIRNQFDALKAHLSQTKGNPDLKFVPFLNTDIDDASGSILCDAAVKVYAIFAFKLNTATDVFLHILDDATDDTMATTATVGTEIALTSGNDVAAVFYPMGLPHAAGVVAKAYSVRVGVTDSTDTDCPNGFIIVGNP